MRLRGLGGLCAALLATTVASGARASSGIDSPENGIPQLGRAGAWIARADDPLAAYFNPAALSWQPTGVHLGAHLMLMDRCFTRLGPDGQPVSPGNNTPGPGAPGGPEAAVCSEVSPFPNPQLAATLRLTRELAIGLSVSGPHGVGAAEWPEEVPFKNKFGVEVTQPASQRYMLTSTSSTILLPTLSVSYAINDKLSVGAGFIWGLAMIEFVNFTEGVSPSPAPGEQPSDDYLGHADIKAILNAKDMFIPGFVLGGLWSPTDRLDVAAWVKWLDALKSKGDLKAESLYWADTGGKNPDPCGLADQDPVNDQPAGCNLTDEKEAGDLTFRLPMEAKLGVRYHHPRQDPGERPAWARKEDKPVRDPLSEDLFDVELDFTWAHNSVVDNLELRFKPGVAIKGTPGYAPENADVAHEWRDVFGVRLGGDFVVLPGRLAVRAGAFYESKGQDDKYLNVDFHLGHRIGVAGGATVRLGPVDLAAAYQHTFFGTLDNGGQGLLKAISGDRASGFRSQQAVNGGKLESSLNEFGLSGTLRF